MSTVVYTTITRPDMHGQGNTAVYILNFYRMFLYLTEEKVFFSSMLLLSYDQAGQVHLIWFLQQKLMGV